MPETKQVHLKESIISEAGAVKVCTGCHKEISLDMFSFDKRSKDGRQSKCRQCYRKHLEEKRKDPAYNARLAKMRRDNKQKKEIKTTDSEKKARIKYLYGITPEKIEEMRFYQRGRCAICNRSEEDTGRTLVIDHDHELDKVRGLLCNACNTALGLMKDDVERLRRAASYVECYRAYLREVI